MEMNSGLNVLKRHHIGVISTHLIKKALMAVMVLFLIPFLSRAQTINFTASADRTSLTTSDQLEVTFSLNANGSRFRAPAFEGFNVLMGPSQSTSMQFINGAMSQSISFTYVLQPKAEGSYKINVASIEVNGKIYQSNPISINVVKGSASQSRQGGQQNGNPDPGSTEAGNNVFFRSSASKASVYQGEAITVTYKLYTRVSLTSYNVSKLPALNGFWSKDIELPQQLQFRSEVLDGVSYKSAEIKKMVVFPQRSGMLEIEPIEGDVIAQIQNKRRSRSNDPFDAFFNDPFFGGGVQNVKYKIKSSSVKINVKPLPPGAPEGYSAAVGKLNMEAYIDKPETKTNEAVNLKIKISGSGNLQLLEAPKIQFPPDIETYDPKTNDNISITASGVSGSRTFEYLLIPRHAGQFKIAPILFSYFDPEKRTYISMNSPELILKVAKGSDNEAASGTSIQGVNKEDVKLLGKDIRFIKTSNPSFRKTGELFFGTLLYYILMCIPLLLFILFLFYRKKYMEMSGNAALMKQRRATKMARKRLSLADKHLKEKNKEKFYDEVSRALWGYINDKLGIPMAELSKDTANDALRKRNTSEELIENFNETIGHCEFARYAPASDSTEMEKTYNNAISLITKFENRKK
jgi:uncharacterized membrane protein